MKICSRCGAMQEDGAIFCNKCGGSFNNAVIPPQQQSQQPQQQYQQQYQQPQQFQQQYQPQYAAAGVPVGTAVSNGSKKKLIIIISAIAAVIAITLLILFLFVFKSNKDKIIGAWASGDRYLRFDKDGKVKSGYGSIADYNVDGDTLNITYTSYYNDSKYTESYKILKLDSKELQIQDPDGKIVTYTKLDDKEADLKTANANAKLIFTTCNNTASDMIADNKEVDKLEYSGPVSGLTGVLGNAVKLALKENGADSGYVYIHFDPTIDDDALTTTNFAQWSATESGSVIGQYPNPIKTVDDAKKVTFGIRYGS